VSGIVIGGSTFISPSPAFSVSVLGPLPPVSLSFCVKPEGKRLLPSFSFSGEDRDAVIECLFFFSFLLPLPDGILLPSFSLGSGKRRPSSFPGGHRPPPSPPPFLFSHLEKWYTLFFLFFPGMAFLPSPPPFFPPREQDVTRDFPFFWDVELLFSLFFPPLKNKCGFFQNLQERIRSSSPPFLFFFFLLRECEDFFPPFPSLFSMLRHRGSDLPPLWKDMRRVPFLFFFPLSSLKVYFFSPPSPQQGDLKKVPQYEEAFFSPLSPPP